MQFVLYHFKVKHDLESFKVIVEFQATKVYFLKLKPCIVLQSILAT